LPFNRFEKIDCGAFYEVGRFTPRLKKWYFSSLLGQFRQPVMVHLEVVRQPTAEQEAQLKRAGMLVSEQV